MVRRVAEECMICEASPCECNKPAPKAKAVRVPKAPAEKAATPKVTAAPVAPKVDVSAAMKAQAKTSVMTAVVTSETPVIDDATQWRNAIRALAPILHPEERMKYIDDIVGSPTLAERRAAWKAKRG